jgi:hypothetical protein
MYQVSRICDTALLLDRGQVRHFGDVDEAIRLYDEINSGEESPQAEETIFVGTEDLAIESIELLPDRIPTGGRVRAALHYHCGADLEIGKLICHFKTESRILVAMYDSSVSGDAYTLGRGSNVLEVDLGRIRLTGGRYLFSIMATDPTGKIYWFNAREHKMLTVDGNLKSVAFVRIGSDLEANRLGVGGPTGGGDWAGAAPGEGHEG